MKTLTASFNIFIKDDFMEAVAKYVGSSVDEITSDDIYEYISDHIKDATSKVDTFAIEGGDTDGRFICSLETDNVFA